MSGTMLCAARSTAPDTPVTQSRGAQSFFQHGFVSAYSAAEHLTMKSHQRRNLACPCVGQVKDRARTDMKEVHELGLELAP